MAILSNGKFYGFLCSVKETGQKLANGVKEYVEDFVSGFSGHGWKLWEYVKGKWKLEIDTIVVRETMLIFEMLISKVRAIIGAQAITQGHGKVKLVSISEDGTEYLIVLEDEDISILAHDFVRCQTFTGSTAKHYHVEVGSVDIETNTLHVPLSEFDKDEVGNVLYPPTPGDELVQFGNSQNKARQSAIYIHADETGQPAIDVMFDIDSKNWDGKVKIRVGGDIPDSGGLKGFYCENGMIKGTDSNGHTVYCIYPDGTAEFGDSSAKFCTDKSGYIAGGAISWVWNVEKKKCVCTMKDVVLTWDNLSDEAKENLKGKPGKDGMDANLLPWVEDWNNNKTQIGSEHIISPKMFAGTNSGTVDEPVLTGVAIGRGVIRINGVEKTGLFGLKNGQLTFEIDAETGDAVFRGKVETQKSGSRITIDPTTNSLKMYNVNDWPVFTLSFSGDSFAAYPQFTINGLEYEGVAPYVSLTGRKIKSALYYSKDGYGADTTWEINEDGISHFKDKQGFSLTVDLAQTYLPGMTSFHLTRFAPGFLPGYSTAKNGEVYVTSDGTLKIKGYSVES